jgi:16S rRNA (guanine527-N7)-methyltransferase
MNKNDSSTNFDELAFRYRLLEMCHAEALDLTEAQAHLCVRHVGLMLAWNQRHNLTRITRPEDILIKHVLDSLLPACWLPSQGVAIDIGTGAGFPGVPLKILYPELHMHLVESHGKKASFLKVLLGQLRLDRLTVLATRWEDLVRVESLIKPASVALITMRALKLPPKGFAEFAAKTLQPGGTLACWKGPEQPESLSPVEMSDFDLTEQSDGVLVFAGSHGYHLPHDYGARRLMVWRSQRTTSAQIALS